MLTSPTLDKLFALNLAGMARALAEQRESPAYTELPFEDRLGLLVDREATDRENRRLERYLRAAKLRVAATIEDVDFRAQRGLDRGVLLELAAARWVSAHQQVLITGPTGVGKTYLACALAGAAIRAGHSALYTRVPRLLTELATARLDGRLPRLLAAWARIEVLVLDDFALQPLTDAQAADLLEVIEDRAGLRSTIVTSQLPVALWHEGLGEPTVATPSATGSSPVPTGSSCRARRCAAQSHAQRRRLRRARVGRAGDDAGGLPARHLRRGRLPRHEARPAGRGGEDQGMKGTPRVGR